MAPLLNLYSFFYFGLCLVSGIAFSYFLSRKEDLTPTFRGLLVPLACLFFWSVAWSICNSYVAPWTAYVFVFLKNPAILIMGVSASQLAFGFQENSFPRWKDWSLRIHIFLATLAILANGTGFFFREILFDPKMEFYVPNQHVSSPIIQLSILSIAGVLCLILGNTIVALIAKYFRFEGSKKRNTGGFLLAIFGILSLAFADILVDLNYFSKPTFLFLLTNLTIIIMTILVLVSLNQETIPSTVGFKIMTFNLTVLYLILSIVANFLFNRFRADFQNEMSREKHSIKTQLELGSIYPFVYLSDLVVDVQDDSFRINKIDFTKTNLLQIKNRPLTFEHFNLSSFSEDPSGIYWTSDFYAKNHHFFVAIPYIEYRTTVHQTVVWLIVTLLFSLFTIFMLYPVLHKTSIVYPLTRLLAGIRKMQAGDLFVTVKVSSRDEIGELSNSFNEMISIVRDARHQLEQKIEERTESLNQTILELKETQEQLLQAERMSTLGKIAASVAHEINNPLAAIKGSIQFIKEGQSFGENITKTDNDHLAEKFITEFKNQKRSEVTSRFKRKKELIAFFKSKSIPDPISLADTCFDFKMEVVPEEFQKLFDTEEGRFIFQSKLNDFVIGFHLGIIETAVERASKIVFALKHHSYSGPKESQKLLSLKEGIDSVLSMYSTSWKQNIEIDWKVEGDPVILGHADELVQVWTNLIYNSIQACPKDGGKIRIFLKEEQTEAVITIEDNGKGISPDILPRIFEPFFTTKELGMGTGLGLSIVQKIIQNHNGNIQVESLPGKTLFSIRIPLAKS
ncbi:HAMP domain-containing protein [Leptospira kanakyensis]|uniref:histidine kinase n=1 Tax=Leptospira kanakyensis TaxID=2484968 RepID=A0A6N4PVF4_9LEPT|nr:HAMP domain-containing protein [Leptospira kanakyensis]TGK64344.1 HAMP domain-containing protein [Leptospira kanakyensis]TGK67218.1 HAMP domain-containing protein [Leptospira kanakyensis]